MRNEIVQENGCKILLHFYLISVKKLKKKKTQHYFEIRFIEKKQKKIFFLFLF